MTNRVPDFLVNAALDALDDEVKRWRKVPWAPGYTRLTRYPLLSDFDLSAEGANVIPSDEETISFHDVPTGIADDILLRFAMEKVIEKIVEVVQPGGLKVGEGDGKAD